MSRPKRIIVGVSGASGVVYGFELARELAMMDDVETHMVCTDAAYTNMNIEMGLTKEKIRRLLPEHIWSINDFTAPIASGSFRADGMIIAPCSMKSLSAIANGFANNLLIRAADVMLKERKRLVLIVRETPLHKTHLLNMLRVTEMGGIVFPPVPAFYNQPQTIKDLVDHVVGRALDLVGIETNICKRWRDGE